MMYNRKCPICGKLFYVGCSDWVYKVTCYSREDHKAIIYLCSWTCYNKAKKLKEGMSVDASRSFSDLTSEPRT